ncbi:MAG: tetratricopeptide repeat protein [Bacteroidetes bacterium]|nr:tetratricopeptide repeat protein [Bacteroidota bacterium]
MERVEKLKFFLANNPDDSFVQHALALEYIKNGNVNDARALFEDILHREPGYIGSYYHLAKLLENTGEINLAIAWYQKGMEQAKKAKDNRAYNELQAAYEDLVF